MVGKTREAMESSCQTTNLTRPNLTRFVRALMTLTEATLTEVVRAADPP